MRVILSIILSIVFACPVFAQVQTQISIEKDSMKLGDLNNLTVEIKTRNPASIQSYDLSMLSGFEPELSFYPDTMDIEVTADFEFLDWNLGQPVVLRSDNFEKQADGYFVHRNSSRFFAWEVGFFRFPQIELRQDTINQQKEINLESPGIFVMPPKNIQIQDTTKMIAPIADILPEDRSWKDYILYYYIAASLLFLGWLFFYLYRLKYPPIVPEETVVRKPAHEVAEIRLNRLEEKELWQKGEIKAYQTELTYTIREYLEHRFGIQALESTTGEIQRSLAEVEFDQSHSKTLNNILQIADLVKFAKAKPAESIHQDFMDQARGFVEATKMEEVEEEEEPKINEE